VIGKRKRAAHYSVLAKTITRIEFALLRIHPTLSGLSRQSQLRIAPDYGGTALPSHPPDCIYVSMAAILATRGMRRPC